MMQKTPQYVALLFAVALGIIACTKEQNSEKPAYDDAAEIINDSLLFSYRFNTGYQTGDSIFDLFLGGDTLQMELNIAEYKSGWLEIALYNNENEPLLFSRFMQNTDTMLTAAIPLTPHRIRLITEKFTARYHLKLAVVR